MAKNRQRIKHALAIFGWLVAGQSLFAQVVFDSVVNTVMTENSFAEYTGQRSSVWKKADGYYFVLYHRSFSYIDTIKVWDHSSGVITFNKAPEGEAINRRLADALKGLNRFKYYDYSPFYGYPGWSSDLIEKAEDSYELDEHLMYMLGRAYSERATNLLSNQLGTAAPGETLSFANNEELLSSKQLKEYRRYRHRAIELFLQLSKENPNYPTIVGPIGIKASNEQMTAYLELLMYSTPEEAEKELVEANYPKNIAEFGAHLLESCPENAFMFCNGDLDTYTAMYAQKVLNIRPDVRVVNISLLQTPRYIRLMRSTIPMGPPMIGMLSLDDLEKTVFEYARLEENRRPLDMKKVLGKLPDLVNGQLGSEAGNAVLPSNTFSYANGKDSLMVTIRRPYLLRNDIVFYDHLVSDDFGHPICFALTTGRSQFELNRRTTEVGMINLLVTSDYVDHSVDIQSMTWTPVKPSDMYDNSIVANSRIVCIRSAMESMNGGRPDEAMQWLNFSLSIHPVDVHPLDASLLKMVQLMTEIDTERGHELFVEFESNFDSFDNWQPFGYYSKASALRITPEVDAFRDYFNQFKWDE